MAFDGRLYDRPVATMRAYLSQMVKQRESYPAPKPDSKPYTLLAARRPKMLELSAELADGAMPPLDHAGAHASGRSILGREKLLCIIQSLILETDPAKARAAIRMHISVAMRLANYQMNLKSLGFDDHDFQNGCLAGSWIQWSPGAMKLPYVAGWMNNLTLVQITYVSTRNIRDPRRRWTMIRE